MGLPSISEGPLYGMNPFDIISSPYVFLSPAP
jgi:hypothetical protein